MAVINVFNGTVHGESAHLLKEAKSLCYNTPNPDQSIVFIELGKAKADTLTRLCAKMDQSSRPVVESMLKKAQKKLAMAEKVNQYLREEKDNKSIDPRVEKLMAKLTKMSGNPPDIASVADFKKLLTWRNNLTRIGQHVGNPMTVETLNKASKMIFDLDMNLLKKSPDFIRISDSVLSGATSQYYSEVRHPGDHQRQSSVAFAMVYLSNSFQHEHKDPRTIFLIDDYSDETRHTIMAHLIKEIKPEWRISEEVVIKAFANHSLSPVASPEISYPPGANQQEIQLKLKALIDLKNANHHLKSLGAFVGIGYQTLALVFHGTGRISLYNPCGDGQRQFSYEAHFGSVEQAAEFLKKLTDEFYEIPPITFKPYGHMILDALRNAHATPFSTNSFSAMSGTPPPSFETTASPMAYSTGPYIPFISSIQSPASLSALPIGYFPQMPSMPGTPSSPFSGSVSFGPNFPIVEINWSVSENPEEDNGIPVKFSTLIETFPGMAAIKESIQALSQRNKEGFCQSLLHLDKLKEDGWSWIDGMECATLDRIYFHLYRIQDQETPEKIDRNDAAWGIKAFHTEALSTPDQRLRAVQCVRIEELLHSLYFVVINQKYEVGHLVQLLDELEQMKLNPSDLPSGQTNAAHALFGKFYQVYIKAREQDPSLDDPHDEKFNGDFGRCAFRGDFQIAKEIKIDALAELKEDFKAAWRISEK